MKSVENAKKVLRNRQGKNGEVQKAWELCHGSIMEVSRNSQGSVKRLLRMHWNTTNEMLRKIQDKLGLRCAKLSTA